MWEPVLTKRFLYSKNDVKEAIELLKKTNKLEEGTKFDSDKSSRPELIAPEIIDALGVVLAFGAKKYEDRNWEKGMDWGRAYGALQRHLNTWWSGDDLDDETNFSHLHHAACCLMFLIAWEARNVGTDSRNKL